MYYIIGDIGNTSTRICLLNKSKILKSIIFDTKNIFLKGYIKKIFNKFFHKKLKKRNIIFVCCSISIQKKKKISKPQILQFMKLKNLI